MKRFILLFTGILFLSQNQGHTQHCASVYSFDPENQTKQSVIGSTESKNGAKAAGRTCAVQTYGLPVSWKTGEKSTRIYVTGLFRSTDNLEPKDFIWVILRINGRVAKSVLMKGVPKQTIYRISDSLDVPRGSKVTMRAAMVVNEAGEEIWLEKGCLDVCQQTDKPRVSENQKDHGTEEDVEPQMTISNVNEVVRLVWRSGIHPDANCFRLERVSDSGIAEVVGFVKDHCKSSAPCEHVFIDSNAKQNTIGYRVYRVDSKGKSFMLAEEARPAN